MFSLPGIIALVCLIFIRPQEVYPILIEVPIFYIVFAFAVLGLVLDLRLRLIRPRSTPQLVWALLFFAWCTISALARSNEVLTSLRELAILFVWYYLISHGLQTFRSLRLIAVLLLGLTTFLCVIGIHQHAQPQQCLEVDEGVMLTIATGRPDGRPCTTSAECYIGASDPRLQYLCDKVGLMDTSTIGGRIRYRGVLQDPNEVALTVVFSLPFMIVLYQMRRTLTRLATLMIVCAASLTCLIYSQSRGGQLTAVSILAVYFISRTGWKGIISALFVSAPILAYVLSGSGRTDASASTIERLECWYEGMTMFRYHPFFGVGYNQFTEFHFLTAHNSYILAPAELGLPGTFLWLGVLYSSVKIPITALRYFRKDNDNHLLARQWAITVLASLIGMLIGIFFLSFCYHYLHWCYIGIAAAYYHAVKSHEPGFRVHFTLIDFAALICITCAVVSGLYVTTRLLPPY